MCFFLSWQRERCAKRHVALSSDLIKEFFRRFWLCVLVSQINMMNAVIFTLGFPLDSSSSCSLPLPPCHLFSVVALILDFCNYKLNWEHLCLFLDIESRFFHIWIFETFWYFSGTSLCRVNRVLAHIHKQNTSYLCLFKWAFIVYCLFSHWVAMHRALFERKEIWIVHHSNRLQTRCALLFLAQSIKKKFNRFSHASYF